MMTYLLFCFLIHSANIYCRSIVPVTVLGTNSWPETAKIPAHRVSYITMKPLLQGLSQRKILDALFYFSRKKTRDKQDVQQPHQRLNSLSVPRALVCHFVVTRPLPPLQAFCPCSRQEKERSTGRRGSCLKILQHIGLPDKTEDVQLNVFQRNNK